MKSEFLSIITINYNNQKGLKETIQSVVQQTWDQFEYIVIDGGSQDKSKMIIEDYSQYIDHWVSEPDTGIYNAMNKGIKHAHGKYLLFLNSGDVFYDNGVLAEIKSYFNNEISFLIGNLAYFLEGKEYMRRSPECLTFSYLIDKHISHPSTFIKTDMFRKHGFYNENLEIVSDWEFFFKTLGLNGETYKRLDTTITLFDTNGISYDKNNLQKALAERERVLRNYLPTIYNDEIDFFLFQNLKQPSRRIKYLKNIEKSAFLRKTTTLVLSILNSFAHKK